ncbi:hypothetical protein JZO66_04870 [Enterococcus sp. DIV0242_7C1]|uniref:Uncharacterized protein n=1 Tax=Candidatus Enterococcus dunnyi TaxID=1834192 RepID=A0A200J8F5_9ENTE|nr:MULTISPECIES: hypothetical protein [unclassified Enterococcus]MBO0469866.1 hypothetical protein [Enterococcus sp. DIV0242_7C1]OUZ32907.1 hypothetical protein A5889_001616 [Enterococcus sp. 9D6_DIV0238]
MILVKRIVRSIVVFFKKNKLVGQVVKSLIFTVLLLFLLGGLIYFQVSLLSHPSELDQTPKEEDVLFQSTDFTEVDRQLLLETKRVQGEGTNLSSFLKQIENCIDNLEIFFNGYFLPIK